jgi:nucleosome assembly protein 1-like 1
LRRIEYKSSENADKPLNFSIHLHFDQNEYFENQTLSVHLEIDEPREASKITGTDINWKAGKNVSKKTIQKKQRNKKTGQTRTVSKEEDVESFFNFFKTLEKKEVTIKISI